MKLKIFLPYLLLAAALIFSCCSTEAAIQEILSGSASAPVFLECRALSSTEIAFRFSQPVRMVSLFMEPSSQIVSCEEGDEILVVLSQPLKEGEKVIADILVEDESRNTLNVLVPFRARNDRVPDLVINELRTEYSGSANRGEYIEFFANGAGNMGALRLFIAGYSLTKPVFEFPPAEIKAGEYIVLHLRTMGEGCVDESGNNLALSGGYEALPDARDFWVAGSSKLLHKTDAVYLVDQDDRIIDAVLFTENTGSAWEKQFITSAAELFARQGVWFSKDGEGMAPGSYVLTSSDAFSSSSTTNTRTICRDESLKNSRSAGNWYITANSSYTPGKPNSTKRYNN